MATPPKNPVKTANKLNAPIIKPPTHLITEEKRIWNDTIKANPHLNSKGYAMILEAFVIAMRRLREARKLVDQEGFIVQSGMGGEKKHPALTVEQACLTAISGLSVKLGIAAPARGRVGNAAKAEPEKPKDTDARTKVKGQPKLRIAG